MGCVIAVHNPSQMGTKTFFEDFGGDLDMDTRKNLTNLLKSERYSKLCFCLQYPFKSFLEIPSASSLVYRRE